MGPATRKRVNVAVVDSWLHARDVEAYLKEYGVDVKVVTKHAIQVHPDHIEKVKAIGKSFKQWIEEKNERATNRDVRVSPAKVA